MSPIKFGFTNEHHLSKSNFHIIKQVMPLKKLIYVTNPHIKYPKVMMTVKTEGFYFVKAYDSLIKVITLRVT
jgi:hypothetical protein